MSEVVTALAGQSFEGRVQVKDAGLQGMITLRVDVSDPNAVTALRAAGFEIPEQGAVRGGLHGGALWMSPDEVLLVCPFDDIPETLARIEQQLGALHFLAADVSDARCVVELTGEGHALREVLAKLTPADLRPDVFKVGTLRRTRLAQVPAAIWFESDERAIVVAFRSVADYVYALLCDAAESGEVGYF